MLVVLGLTIGYTKSPFYTPMVGEGNQQWAGYNSVFDHVTLWRLLILQHSEIYLSSVIL